MKPFMSICFLTLLIITGCSTVPAIENTPGYIDESDLLDSLQDEQSFIRELAARDLGVKRNLEAAEALVSLLESPTELNFVKAAAVESVGLIKNPIVIPAVENLLMSSPCPEVRFQCVRTLSLFYGIKPSVKGAIEAARRDECLLVRSLCEAELTKIEGAKK